ncbi:dnaJ homolog subfamily C member 21-like [Macrobrachium nipponense]|uniref:dnaJ homolog subfamily C member 21-like n=1 Tax=Macrobrachium nipponense TaxID=159736 RepID=UPI0030C89F0B
MELHGCPYDILGVAEDAALKEIERAYRKLALKSHPDKFQGPQAERQQVKEMMQKINYANDILRDADEREEYDTLRGFVKDVVDKLFEDPSFPMNPMMKKKMSQNCLRKRKNVMKRTKRRKRTKRKNLLARRHKIGGVSNASVLEVFIATTSTTYDRRSNTSTAITNF